MDNKHDLSPNGQEDEELQGDYITDADESTTQTVVDESPQPMVVTGGHEAVNQFFEWPIIRPDGAFQPIQYKAFGHLLSNGIDPENMRAATLIHTITLSARWGYPISAMIVSEEQRLAVKFLDQCLKLAPKDATIEFGNLKPDHLYINGGELLNGKCIICTEPTGFSKVSTDLELILSRGNTVRQELEKGKYGVGLSEYRSNILGLTFTRNAADEMRSRLVPVLGEMSSRVRLSTIHSFCLHLLKVEGKVFEILSGKEQLVFIKNVMKGLKVKDLTVGTVLREISLAKNNIIDPQEFKALFSGDKTMMRIADIYQAYDEAKEHKLLLDFDDLLLETYYLLRDNDEVRTKYQGSFQSILVDEFQDTNPVQFELLRLLIRDHGDHDASSFWVAGDDHQAIYSFTGASVGNILNFQSMFPGSRQFILDLNYRSTPQILAACQNLIRHNVKQIHKELKTDNPDGDGIVVLEASNEETEAMGVVNEIVDLIERRGYQYSNIAVLYRANFQSRYVEEAFLQNKIPYHIQSGRTFYDRYEVKCLLDYLRVIHAPDSDEADEALLNILNVPVRYVSNQVKDQLKDYCRKQGIHLYTGLKSMIITVPYVRKLIREFAAFMDPLIESAETLEPVQVIQKIRIIWDYDRFIVDEDIPSPDDIKISNINQLQLAAARYSNIAAFLEYADSFTDETVGDDKEGVSLMTVHKAKGLEFAVVFVIGLVEGLMPSGKGNLEEERRICFVAISRAMKLLFVSYPLNYLGQPSKKSMFLDEMLGKRDIDLHKSAA